MVAEQLTPVGDCARSVSPMLVVGFSLSGSSVAIMVADLVLPAWGVLPSWAPGLCSLVVPLLVIGLIGWSPARFETWHGAGPTRQRYVNAALSLPAMGILLINLDGAGSGAPVSYGWPLVAGAVAGLLGLALGLAAARSPGVAAPRTLICFFTAFMAAYGFGGALVADIQLDNTPGQVVEVSVEDMQQSHSRRYDSFRLKVAPFGPYSKAKWVEVSATAFETIKPGQAACATVHQGALSLPWFTVATCALP